MRKLVKHKKISGALVIAVPFGKYRKTPQSGTINFILVYLTIANSNNFVVSKKYLFLMSFLYVHVYIKFCSYSFRIFSRL